MRRNREDEREFSLIAARYGIDASEVRRIVTSFFDILHLEARRLPFDNPARIYSKEKFNGLVTVYHIPFIGRIGPVYSRYLLWRRNESENMEQTARSAMRKESRKERAERIAASLLYGKPSVNDAEKKYRRVWIVKQDGKKLAGQVIPLKEE